MVNPDAFECDCCGREWVPNDHRGQFEQPCWKCGGMGYRIGLVTYECKCHNVFRGVGRLNVKSRCYQCNRMATADDIEPLRLIHTKSNRNHSCALCKGSGNCPLLPPGWRRGQPDDDYNSDDCSADDCNSADYNSDDGTGYRVGLVTYRCRKQTCGNTFVGVGRLDVKSRCYHCNRMATADTIEPLRALRRSLNYYH